MKDPFPLPPISRLATLTTNPLASTLSLATLPAHAHEILYSFTLYTIIFSAVAPAASRRLFPRTYGSLTPKQRVSWHVRVTSLVQSVVICAVAGYVIRRDRQRAGMDWRGRVWGYTGAMGMVEGMAMGYFWWDLWISARYFDVFGGSSLFHALSALVVTGLGFRPFANYYGLNFILYELSTPFLNIHWFLDKLSLTGSTLQLVNAAFLLTTFFGARCVWGTYQSYRIYQDLFKALTLSEAERPLAVLAGMAQGQEYDVLSGGGVGSASVPLWLAGLYAGSNTVLSLLQFYWFSKMLTAVSKRFGGRGGAKGGAERKKKGGTEESRKES